MNILVFVGLGVLLIGGIGFLITAFKQSIVWGLLCLLVSPVSLLFLIKHWGKAKKTFFIQLAGLAIMIVADILARSTNL
ncbi:hypothetical protein [Colwellia sp. Bg11-28]|uniref:hypothetical protein n=1 Tax=Colwellia sp. Bg11-28 TaxID=2058305 RepID=UPI000C346BC3|nr:hypothetical protein [Colwellia sp. Bg11-28]PKH86203.1 hypothetical protein CXF79_22270 [Colwellia sp. Bg11-28]